MSIHISKICASAFYRLHIIGRIRKFLSLDATKTLVHAFVTSRIDYCNIKTVTAICAHNLKKRRVKTDLETLKLNILQRNVLSKSRNANI